MWFTSFGEKGTIICSVSKPSCRISVAGPYDTTTTTGPRWAVYNTRRGLNKYTRQVVARDGQRDFFWFIYSIQVCSNPRPYDQFDNHCWAVWKCMDVTWDVRWSIERDWTSDTTWPSNFDNASLRQKWSNFNSYSTPVQKFKTDSDRCFGVFWQWQQHVVTPFVVDSSIASTSHCTHPTASTGVNGWVRRSIWISAHCGDPKVPPRKILR